MPCLSYRPTPLDAMPHYAIIHVCTTAVSHLHHHTARILLLGLGIKHLALRAQPIGFRDKTVDLLAALQYGFDGFVQDDFGLVEFFLDLAQTYMSTSPSCHIRATVDVGLGVGVGVLGGSDAPS